MLAVKRGLETGPVCPEAGDQLATQLVGIHHVAHHPPDQHAPAAARHQVDLVNLQRHDRVVRGVLELGSLARAQDDLVAIEQVASELRRKHQIDEGERKHKGKVDFAARLAKLARLPIQVGQRIRRQRPLGRVIHRLERLPNRVAGCERPGAAGPEGLGVTNGRSLVNGVAAGVQGDRSPVLATGEGRPAGRTAGDGDRKVRSRLGAAAVVDHVLLHQEVGGLVVVGDGASLLLTRGERADAAR